MWTKLQAPVLGLKEWLWVVAEEKFCLFHAGDTRSRAELEQSACALSLTASTERDDFSVYNGYSVTAQQKCLAHLRAAFQEGGEVGVR